MCPMCHIGRLLGFFRTCKFRTEILLIHVHHILVPCVVAVVRPLTAHMLFVYSDRNSIKPGDIKHGIIRGASYVLARYCLDHLYRLLSDVYHRFPGTITDS